MGNHSLESANSILVGNKATHNEILENYLNPHNEVLTELHQRFRNMSRSVNFER